MSYLCIVYLSFYSNHLISVIFFQDFLWSRLTALELFYFVFKLFIAGINISTILQSIVLAESLSILLHNLLDLSKDRLIFDGGWKFIRLSLDYLSKDIS